MSARDVVVFELDEARSAIDAAAVIEIVRAVAIRPLPAQPDFIAGVIDLRGSVVPVLDVRTRLGFPAKDVNLTDNFIIAKVRSRTVALWVGRMIDLLAHSADAIAERGGLLVGDRTLRGVARIGQGLVVIHDVDEFLTQAEDDALAAVDAR